MLLPGWTGGSSIHRTGIYHSCSENFHGIAIVVRFFRENIALTSSYDHLQIVWVQSVQVGQQPYKLAIDCENAPRVNELMKTILNEECIALPTCYITIKTNKSGPKSHFLATLADLQPCGLTSASPFWYILKCPGSPSF